jgi:hypothetical protein
LFLLSLANTNFARNVVKISLADRLQKNVQETRASMEAEFESERANHQKLVKDYARLQQRFENLRGELQTSPGPRGQGHRRSPSELSTISLESGLESAVDGSAVGEVRAAYKSEPFYLIYFWTLYRFSTLT